MVGGESNGSVRLTGSKWKMENSLIIWLTDVEEIVDAFLMLKICLYTAALCDCCSYSPTEHSSLHHEQKSDNTRSVLQCAPCPSRCDARAVASLQSAEFQFVKDRNMISILSTLRWCFLTIDKAAAGSPFVTGNLSSLLREKPENSRSPLVFLSNLSLTEAEVPVAAAVNISPVFSWLQQVPKMSPTATETIWHCSLL